ncbi:porin [Roseibium sp.]|uniref:porin n=1 Tax=Roseibium sp. TaxID=1936156 RepID=UPI003A96D8DB
MNFKSLMLGAAAAAAATGAHAADLPVAPEPVDYVRVCDAYGARFYYIPGTETCLRVGGRVRANYIANNFADDGTWGGRGEALDFNAEGYLYLDSRTATEFGLLRTFTEIEVESDNEVFLGKAYIQWGGLTFGHATSFFDFFTGQAFIGVVGRNWSDTTVDLAAYTAAFGNGFSATLSIEDGAYRNTGVSTVTGVTLANTTTVAYGGHKMPDLVANLRVDQGWGSAQLSGAVHNVRHSVAAYEGATGWAVGGGVIINLPMLSSGSNLAFQAQYADGALSYIGAPSTVSNALGSTASLWDADTTGDTSTGFSISGGIYHQATSTIGIALDGSYMDIELANSGAAMIAGAPNSIDVTRWAIDGSVKWTPVSGLELGADMGYANTEVENYDYDDIRVGFRVQRTF